MKKPFTTFYNTTMKVFGDLKVYKFPFFLLYDPGGYLLKGDEIRQVMNTIKPGDILIRGFKNYLDGYFIPGFFSHAGLYLGTVPNKSNVTLTSDTRKNFYAEGEQIVVHAMAEGVFMEDLLNFCRCDYLVILRTENVSQTEIDYIYNDALMRLGTPYDFKFDFSQNHNLSCTEFVYVCMKEKMQQANVKLRNRRAPFRLRLVLIPDDFINSDLQIIWKSNKIPEKTIRKIKSH